MSNETTIQIIDALSSVNIIDDKKKPEVIEIGTSGFNSSITILDGTASEFLEVTTSEADSSISIDETIRESNVIEITSDQELEVVDGSNYVVAPINVSISQEQLVEAVNNAIYDRQIIKLDASRPVAYIGYITRIVKLDYVQFPPIVSYAVITNLTTDWQNRQNLNYILT